MAFIHPNQQVSFNFLVDRVTPERLGAQYTMEYWGHPILQAWKRVLNARPSGDAAASAANYYLPRLIEENARVLPRADRDRIGDPSGPNAFVIRHGLGERSDLAEHRLTVYGNTILTIERKDDPQAVYQAATRGEPIIDAAYDVYRSGNALTLVKEPCAPSFMRELVFRLRVTPVNADDLPHWRRADGFETLSGPLSGHGALRDGKCVVSLPLPDYPIANLEFDGVQNSWTTPRRGRRRSWRSSPGNWRRARSMRFTWRTAASCTSKSRARRTNGASFLPPRYPGAR